MEKTPEQFLDLVEAWIKSIVIDMYSEHVGDTLDKNNKREALIAFIKDVD